MSTYSYEEIRKRVYEWCQNDILMKLKKQDEIEISKNNDEALIVDLTFDNCLAQLIVSNPTFAPYQFVSFEAMTLDSDKAQESGIPEMVYFFYDTDKMLEKDVITELGIGIQYCSNYIPNLLAKTYLNKHGNLFIECRKLFQAVHPNDIEKINKEILNSEFICVNVEAQYLVLTNNILSLRILPQFFI